MRRNKKKCEIENNNYEEMGILFVCLTKKNNSSSAASESSYASSRSKVALMVNISFQGHLVR